MTWKELFAKVFVRHAEVIQVTADARYVVLCDSNEVAPEAAEAIMDHLGNIGVKAMVLLVQDVEKTIRIMELKP